MFLDQIQGDQTQNKRKLHDPLPARTVIRLGRSPLVLPELRSVVLFQLHWRQADRNALLYSGIVLDVLCQGYQTSRRISVGRLLESKKGTASILVNFPAADAIRKATIGIGTGIFKTSGHDTRISDFLEILEKRSSLVALIRGCESESAIVVLPDWAGLAVCWWKS
jgi:hypothetical protein